MLRQLKTGRQLATFLCLLSSRARLDPAFAAIAPPKRRAGDPLLIAARGPPPPSAGARALWRACADGGGYRAGAPRRPPRGAHAGPAPAGAAPSAVRAIRMPVRGGSASSRSTTAACWRSRAVPKRARQDGRRSRATPVGAGRVGLQARDRRGAGRRRRLPRTRVCYHDGVHAVEASNLTTDPRSTALQHARLRPGQVAERDHRAAGARSPRRAALERVRARARLRRAAAVRAPRRRLRR